MVTVDIDAVANADYVIPTSPTPGQGQVLNLTLPAYQVTPAVSISDQGVTVSGLVVTFPITSDAPAPASGLAVTADVTGTAALSIPSDATASGSISSGQMEGTIAYTLPSMPNISGDDPQLTLTLTSDDSDYTVNSEAPAATYTIPAVTALDDAFAVDEDDTYDGTAGNVLTDMSTGDAAGVGDTLTVTRYVNGDGGDTGFADDASGITAAGTALDGHWGRLIIAADGAISWNANSEAVINALDAGATPEFLFNYEVSDGTTVTRTGHLRLTIVGANDAPVLTVDGSPILDVTERGGINNGIGGQPNASGAFAHSDPDAGDTGFDAGTTTGGTIQGSVADANTWTDGNGELDDMNAVAAAFIGTYGTMNLYADGNWYYVLADADTDADLSNEAFQAALQALDTLQAPAHGGSAGMDTFEFRILDDGATADRYSNIEKVTITVTGANDAPMNSGATNQTVYLNSAFRYSVPAFTDPDTEDTLTYTVGYPNGNRPTWTTFNAGSFSGMPTQTEHITTAPIDINVEATDRGGLKSSVRFTLTVVEGTNNDPVAVADTLSVNENETYDGTVGNVVTDPTTGDTDGDGGTPYVTRYAAGDAALGDDATAVGTALEGDWGSLTIAADGAVSWNANDVAAIDALDGGDTPDDLEFTFTYQVSDGSAEDTATLTLTINGQNDAPMLSLDGTPVLEVTEGDTREAMASGDFLHSDPDGDDTGFSATTGIIQARGQTRAGGSGSWTAGGSGDIEGFYGDLTLNADGSWTYELDNVERNTNRLDADDQVTELFLVRINNGAAHPEATRYSNEFDLNITVVGGNDAPVLSTSGTLDLAVTEMGINEPGDSSAGGMFAVTDPDNDDIGFGGGGFAPSGNIEGAVAGQRLMEEGRGHLHTQRRRHHHHRRRDHRGHLRRPDAERRRRLDLPA